MHLYAGNSAILNLDDPHHEAIRHLAHTWCSDYEDGRSPAERFTRDEIEAAFSSIGFFHLDWSSITQPARLTRNRPPTTPALYRGSRYRGRLGWSWTPDYYQAMSYAWRHGGVVWQREHLDENELLAIIDGPVIHQPEQLPVLDHLAEWITRPPAPRDVTISPDRRPDWLRTSHEERRLARKLLRQLTGHIGPDVETAAANQLRALEQGALA